MQDRKPALEGPRLHGADAVDAERGVNPQQAIQQVTAYLQTHTGINAVMTLNNAIGTALVTSAPASKPKIATFDLNSGVEQDLKNSSMAFAIDQQQYLQGYLPIVFLYLYNKDNGQSVGGGTPSPAGRWS